MSYKITDKITWVGKTDWELMKFHGNEYSTHRGTTYNSYLIRDEKTVLIDTVWDPFGIEFVDNLKKEINIQEIDYIIINHGEVDHSGALEELMKQIPDTPIYCTKNGIDSLKGRFHKEWNFIEVKTGDTLEIGASKLIFVEARMLHWPDSMFTYMTEENILFSNDAFGQHYASEELFNDLVDNCELYQEATKYYANILTPFSKLVINKIQEILSLNLPVNMICTSHGIIWRDNPLQIVNKYMEWAKDYQENQITILYDTMWDDTKIMAEGIAKGIRLKDNNVTIKLFNVAKTDKNDVITEIFKSKAFLVGSPAINGGILFSIAGILEMIKGLKFKNKKAVAFGSYGWSGENIKIISEELQKAGINVIDEGIKVKWTPDEESYNRCIEYGKTLTIRIQ